MIAIEAISPVPSAIASARQQEEAGGQRTQFFPKAPLNKLIRGIQITPEVMRQKNKADNRAAHDIAHHHLQKCEIGIVSQTWNADDSESARFRRDDGERNRPPGYVTIGEKIRAQRALLLAKAQPEQGYPRQVQRDNREVELVQAHQST